MILIFQAALIEKLLHHDPDVAEQGLYVSALCHEKSIMSGLVSDVLELRKRRFEISAGAPRAGRKGGVDQLS